MPLWHRVPQATFLQGWPCTVDTHLIPSVNDFRFTVDLQTWVSCSEAMGFSTSRSKKIIFISLINNELLYTSPKSFPRKDGFEHVNKRYSGAFTHSKQSNVAWSFRLYNQSHVQRKVKAQGHSSSDTFDVHPNPACWTFTDWHSYNINTNSNKVIHGLLRFPWMMLQLVKKELQYELGASQGSKSHLLHHGY